MDGNAAEGASSTYFPGGYGSFAPGVAPDPGFTFTNFTFLYDAQVNQTVLQGRVNLNLDTYAVIDLVGGLYSFDKKVLGGTFVMGGNYPLWLCRFEDYNHRPDGGPVS